MTAGSAASSLDQRILATWRAAFPELTDPLDQRGTSILVDERVSPTAWVSLWPAGERVVARVAPEVAERLQAVLDRSPADHRMTADDVTGCWPDATVERSPQRLHVLDTVTFRPALPAPGQQVRELTEFDRDTFDDLLGRCSDDDRDEGDVDIGGEHELTVGLQIGDRLVAAASMFEWRGFSDLGVLVDPETRRQRAGTVVVSALCERLLDGPRVVVYRYSLDNVGSAGIARSLGLRALGVAESVRPSGVAPR